MEVVRVVVLVCCCLLTFGSYFSYDVPGALTDDFRVVLAQNKTSEQGLMYSVYSLPNTLQPFFGGLVIDKVLGLRRGAAICCSLVAVGCSVVALAASVTTWSGQAAAFELALLGRFVFGLGGETLSVCQNAFCAKWFRGAELATAFAIVLSFARVGSAVNFAITPKLSSDYGFAFALWLSAMLCFVSVGASFVLWYVDQAYEHTLDEEEDENSQAQGQGQGEHEGNGAEEPLLAGGRRRADSLDASTRNQQEQEEDASDELLLVNRSERETHEEASHSTTEKSTWEALMSVLGPREILIYLICVQFYIAVFIFIAIASKLLVDKFEGVDKVSAGLLVSIPYTVSAVVSPLLGLTMDKVGRGLVFVGLACASLCGVHISFAFFAESVSPTAVMIWLGLAYSTCAASLWPMIALVVESRNISTAYGLMMSIQNTGLAIAPVFIMKMVPTSKADLSNYDTIESIFAGFAFGALLCTIALYFVDLRFDGALCAKPESQALVVRPSPHINPLNPRPSPFLHGVYRAGVDQGRTPIAPKTPQAIRQQYFRKLRIQSHI